MALRLVVVGLQLLLKERSLFKIKAPSLVVVVAAVVVGIIKLEIFRNSQRGLVVAVVVVEVNLVVLLGKQELIGQMVDLGKQDKQELFQLVELVVLAELYRLGRVVAVQHHFQVVQEEQQVKQDKLARVDQEIQVVQQDIILKVMEILLGKNQEHDKVKYNQQYKGNFKWLK
jgi:hypothetical protein